MNLLRTLFLQLLRVPGPPEPPPGATSSVSAFRASSRYLSYRMIGWAISQLFALAGILFFLFVFRIEDQVDWAYGWLFSVFELLALVGFAFQFVWSFLTIRLDWEQRWYLVTDSAVRIREGLFRVREQTMTIANIQNMRVTQGPIERLFRIADLEVQTAGGGGGRKEESGKDFRKDNLHLGRLRGLEDAQAVRDRLRQAVARHRDSGLGDPDDVSASMPAEGRVGSAPREESPVAVPALDVLDVLDAARALVAESRALRAELEAP